MNRKNCSGGGYYPTLFCPPGLGLIRGIAFDQLCRVGAQVVLHGLDTADLGTDGLLSHLPRDAVVDEPLTQRHDFNVSSSRLPNLAFGQRPKAISSYFHSAI